MIHRHDVSTGARRSQTTFLPWHTLTLRRPPNHSRKHAQQGYSSSRVDNNLAHPGFVVLDSPLLSYREPDGAEDDLSETNLNGNFYRYLLGFESDRQAIIVENMDPPSDVELGNPVIHFSGMDDEGRFGLFPR